MKRVWLGVIVALVVIAAGGLAYWLNRPETFYQAPATPKPTGSVTSSTVPDFDHVVIIVLENRGFNAIIGNKNAPYLNQLAKNYALAKHYAANFHPSLPNYIALTSGTNAGITNDCNPPGGSCLADVKSIAGEIEASGRRWKAYQESMPMPCTTHNSGQYAVRHDPFVYYPSILNDKNRCDAHVVPYDQLSRDLSDNKLPDYSFITPNICHDMHDCSVKIGDDWLKAEVPKILDSKTFSRSKSLLIITFDEAEKSDKSNLIPTILAGPLVKKHFSSDAPYDHYSLLHTIESGWHLQPLTKNDAKAPFMDEFFQ